MLRDLREVEVGRLSISGAMSPSHFVSPIQTTINRLTASIEGAVWILDSGATKHVSGNRSLFTNFNPENSQSVQTASGEILPIGGTGDVVISLSNQSTLTLTDVLYVPGLTVNLVSTPRLWHKGIAVGFPPGKPAILEYGSQFIAHADNVEDQFLLRNEDVLAMHSNDAPPCFKVSKKTTDIEIWHRRLVYLGYRNVVANAKKVAGMEGVHGPFPEELCEPCLKGKQQSEPTRHPMSKATEFLNEIHVDIGGPLPLTFRGHRFFLLIKDDASGMFFVYVLKTKGEIFARLKEFRTWIEAQSQKKIKRIRSGNELRSHQFDAWFKETGIQWEPSAPYTPEQNGVIEKGMYTIVGSIRAVHKSFGLPIGLWDITIEGIVHIWNRIATSTVPGKVTLFQVVNGVQPDVSHLRALGCRSYVYIPKTTMRHKLDDRSWKGILVGYGGTNQWKVYNPKTKRVHLSRDVRFDEKHSYYSNDGIGPPDCLEDESDEEDVAEFWTDKDDERLAELQGEQVSVGVDPTSRYRLSDDVAEEEEEFQDAPEGNRQQTSLPEDPVLRSPMPPPAVAGRPRDPIPDDIFDRNAAAGAAESSTTSHPPPVSKAPSPPPSYRETRSSRNGDNRPNYKDLHRGINFAESKHHCHMNRVFAALASGDSLGLGLPYASEPRSYKEARRSIE